MPHRPPGSGASTSARAGRPTTTVACDGCHRMSFPHGGTYGSPTTGQFNMCNCTTSRGVRPAVPTPAPRLRQGRSPNRAGTASRSTGPDTKKIALDPAESSAINDAPLLGQERRRVKLWFQAPRQVGGPAVCPDIQLFRPRCAAAECPRAGRGPRPRGSGDARRACGST